MQKIIVKETTKPGRLAKFIALSPETEFEVEYTGIRACGVIATAHSIILRYYPIKYLLNTELHDCKHGTITKDDSFFKELDELVNNCLREIKENG